MLDLDATYTYTHDLGDGPEAFTITPKIHVRERSGAVITSIGGLHALLADRIDAITDLGDRLHTITVLGGARIVISDTALKPGMLSISSRDDGRIRTTYTGTRDLPVDAVLDLAEQLRTQLSK